MDNFNCFWFFIQLSNYQLLLWKANLNKKGKEKYQS
jgi:hypothetical protein